MKKIFLLTALCALAMAGNAKTYNYLCAITEVTVDTLKNNIKNQFTINIKQYAKNTSEYNKDTVYYNTVKLVLNSDDRTLEGTYTTIGASETSNSANTNDQTIGLVDSELYSGKTRRLLRADSVSKFVIERVDDTHYQITECTLYFTAAALQDRGKNTYSYTYSFAFSEISKQGIGQTPFEFGWDKEFHAAVYNYDMTVNGVMVERNDNEYGQVRYFLTLNCSGKNRANNAVRNYEVQLDIMPDDESIAGTFGTSSGMPLFYGYSYVKDIKGKRTRYLAKDSANVIQIKDKGNHQYSFYGGTFICVDRDTYYKRDTAVHYYHFNDNGGDGIAFSYDESNKSIELTLTKVKVEPQTTGDEISGFKLYIDAAYNGVNYEVVVYIENEQLYGSFIANDKMTLWTSVGHGDVSSYIKSGTVTINQKNGNTYTISGSLLCENDYSYQIPAFDFTYGTATGVESIQPSVISNQKVLRDGQMIIIRDGKEYNAFGVEL